MTPIEQALGLFVLLGLMALPRLAMNGRVLTGILAAGMVVATVLWFGWVEQLPNGLGNVAQALGVALAAAAFGLGVAVRAVVLFGRKRGWPKATDALLSLATVAVMGLGLLIFFDML